MATLNKLFTNLMLLGLAISIITYLFSAFNFDPQVQSQFVSLASWQGWFALDPFTILFAGGAIAISVVALLLRTGTYAIYALLIAALGMVIKPIQDIILAIPNLLTGWLPDSTNPLPPDPITGAYPLNPIVVVIKLVYAFAAFWFIFGLVIQRDVS